MIATPTAADLGAIEILAEELARAAKMPQQATGESILPLRVIDRMKVDLERASSASRLWALPDEPTRPSMVADGSYEEYAVQLPDGRLLSGEEDLQAAECDCEAFWTPNFEAAVDIADEVREVLEDLGVNTILEDNRVLVVARVVSYSVTPATPVEE